MKERHKVIHPRKARVAQAADGLQSTIFADLIVGDMVANRDEGGSDQ